MAVVENKVVTDVNNPVPGKGWNLFRMPFWQNGTSSQQQQHQQQNLCKIKSQSQTEDATVLDSTGIHSVSAVARALLPAKRRLRLDPENKLYFPYEPGKQVLSAIRILNRSHSHVAFKFQTTAPKSCFMRPPGGILAPGEFIIATVFKFIELPEHADKPPDKKSKDKFKIVSLKVKEGLDYVSELFEEQKDLVAVEQILRVVFLDPQRSTRKLEKLRKQLAEAEAALEARKKPPEDTVRRLVGEGLVIDEWRERRERYLAQQHIEGGDYT